MFTNSVNKSCYSEFDQRANLCDLHQLGLPNENIAEIKTQARSVACIVMKNIFTGLDQLDPAVDTLSQKAFKESNGCSFAEGESFTKEPACGIGTAFLIGEWLALTAAHCVYDDEKQVLKTTLIQNSCLIFDYAMTSCEKCSDIKKNTWNCDYSKNNKYTYTVLASKYSRGDNWEDWAILKLDRKVENRQPLKINFTKQVDLSEKLYMLGHPIGLPMKFTRNAEVTKHGHDELFKDKFFQANLDAFVGNSGSPIFLFNTHEVVGMLCAGKINDFDIDQKNKLVRTHRATSKDREINGDERCHKITALTFLYAALSSLDIPSVFPNFQIQPGLSIEGECKVHGMVLIHKGFSKGQPNDCFDMNYQCSYTNCTQCNQHIDYDDLNQIVLKSCDYTIDAMNSARKRIQETLKLEVNQCYNINIEKWKFFEIKVEPLK